MLENIRNSSSKDGQMKCDIFESELKNARKSLRRSTSFHRQISLAVPTTEAQEATVSEKHTRIH